MARVCRTRRRDASPGIHFESCVNEKAAYESALAGAYASKRTACLFSVEGVYEALDPLMSSAYTGVKGGFVVVCVKEGDARRHSPRPLFKTTCARLGRHSRRSGCRAPFRLRRLRALRDTVPPGNAAHEGTFPQGGRECWSRALCFREEPGPVGRCSAVQVQTPQGAQREDREDPQ